MYVSGHTFFLCVDIGTQEKLIIPCGDVKAWLMTRHVSLDSEDSTAFRTSASQRRPENDVQNLNSRGDTA